MDGIGQKMVGEELVKIASIILKADGDRDHMNKSDLTCEQTQLIAQHLKCVARDLGYREPAR